MTILYATTGAPVPVYDTAGRLVWGDAPAPDPDPGPGPEPNPDDLTTAWHGEHTALMQPSWSHIIRVGPGREHTTLDTAVTAARGAGPSNAGEAPRSTFFNIPHRSGRVAGWRTAIILDPGTYQVSVLDLGDGIDLLGNGDSRGDVVVQTDGTATGRYALRFYGSMYAANLTLHHVAGAAGNNYPMHGSTIAGTTHFTAVFDNVHFLEDNPGAASGIAGWDMPDGMNATMYRCRFETTTDSYAGVNFHNMPGQTIGVECDFIECETDPRYPLAVSYAYTPGIGRWATHGCTHLDGTPIPDQEAINGGTPTAPSAPVLPEGGITSMEASKYAPTSPVGIDGTQPVTLPAGQTWIVPLPAGSMMAEGIALDITDPGAGVAAALWVGSGAVPSWHLLWPTWTTTTGTVTLPTTRWRVWVERDPRLTFWLAVTTKTGAAMQGAVVPGARIHEKATPDEGLSKVAEGAALPAGTVVPVGRLV